MATGIPYLDKTINVMAGCRKLSRGCRECFALLDAWRMSTHPYRAISNKYATTVYKKENGELAWTGKITFAENAYDNLVKLQKSRKRKRIGISFNSDLFFAAIPTDFICKIFKAAVAAPQHDFFFLTKRPERVVQVADALRKYWKIDLAHLPHIVLGVSVESPELWDRYYDLTRANAARYWLSLEPLVAWPKGLADALDYVPPAWVVVGGENGKRAAKLPAKSVREVKARCSARDIPFFFKGWGSYMPTAQGEALRSDVIKPHSFVEENGNSYFKTSTSVPILDGCIKDNQNFPPMAELSPELALNLKVKQ